MRFGLNDAHWDIIAKKLIVPLKNQGAQVWIFGSRARNDHRDFSDMDVLYSTPAQLPTGLISTINEDLENSRLPIKVDIVNIEDLADSYKDNVLKDRISI